MLTLTLLSLLAAVPGDVPCNRSGDRCSANGRSKNGLAFFEFAPASGAGLVSAGNLCDQLSASEKVGNWWCLNGDGTMASGSAVTLTATGSPTTSSDRTCPNGPDCAALTSQRMTTTSGYDSAAMAAENSDLSVCWWGVLDDASASYLVSQASAYSGTTTSYLLNSSSSLFRITITDGASFTEAAAAAGSHLPGAPTIACGTWVKGAAARISVNGTITAAGSSLANRLTTSWAHTVNGLNGTRTGAVKNRTFGAFYTATALSDARLQAIARAVLADAPTGAKGEALTLTRASVQFCESSDGTGSLVPANRLCVTRGGTTAAQGSFVQSTLRTEELDNASWADVGTPTVTANSIVSAGGTLTADTINDNDAAAFEGRSQSVTVTAAAAYTMSCYAKAGTLAKIRLSLDGTTGDTTSLSSSSWTRVSVTDASTSGVSVSAQVLAGTATTDTGTTYVWGCNLTPGSSLRPYIPATSAAVTTAAEVPYLTLTNAPALNSIEATVSLPATFATTARVMSVYKDATNAFDMYVDTTAANKLNCLATVGGVTYSGLSTAGVTASTTQRLSCSYDGTSVIACIDGTCNSTARAFTMFSAATRVYLGTYATTGAEINPSPVIKGVKADPSPTRFR